MLARRMHGAAATGHPPVGYINGHAGYKALQWQPASAAIWDVYHYDDTYQYDDIHISMVIHIITMIYIYDDPKVNPGPDLEYLGTRACIDYGLFIYWLKEKN